ncbi:unnamed protein product [Rhizophagus irregularis]|nr:unnamed protein product [Rhizophagus irregularis]
MIKSCDKKFCGKAVRRNKDIKIPMVLSSYFGRHFGGSFVFLATVRPLDMRNFQRQVRPLDMSGSFDMFCKVSNSGIGYRRALIGYLEIGDNLGSFKTSCYWTNCFGVLKRVEFRIILSILNNG